MWILLRKDSLKKGYLAENNGSCWRINASTKINKKFVGLVVSPAGFNYKNSRSLLSSDFDLIDVQSAARSFWCFRYREAALKKRGWAK